MDTSNISEFIPDYPDISDENFTYNIARKQEFNQLKLTRSEPVPSKAGDLLQSQIFLKRFFSPETPYKEALLFGGLGTGKCVHPDTIIPLLERNGPIKVKASDIWKRYSSPHQLFDGEGLWCVPSSPLFVKSLDVKDNMIKVAKIVSLYKQDVSETLRKITLEDGSYIIITYLHKLFTSDFCWSSKVGIGQKICVSNKRVNIDFLSIVSIEDIYYKGFVYDFEVEGTHNYFTNKILCHNTCVASAIVENFKNVDVGDFPRGQALIFVKNEELGRNYTNEVANVCTREIYLPKATKAELKKGVEMSEDAKIIRLNRAIAKTYDIVTFETFLRDLPNDEIIKKRFSDRVIIIDEAHVLREKVSESGGEDEEEGGETLVATDKSLNMYKAMHRFLHAVERCRILLLTGTPIWDKTSEIASLLNLILPMDQQLPTGNKFDKEFFIKDKLREDKAQELKDKLRGRVSYLRAMMTTAKRIEEGVTKPWLEHLTVYPDGMSDTQSAYAQKAREEVTKKKVTIKGKKTIVEGKEVVAQSKLVERETKGGTVLKLARDAANAVIPIFDTKGEIIDMGYGPEAFRKYIVKPIQKRTKKGGTVTVQTYSISNRFLIDALRDNLAEYSAKFASIIQDAKDHPNEIMFIYNEEVTGIGGSIMLGLCLEIHGFIRARAASDIARSSGNKRRFAIMTSDIQTTSHPKQISDLLDSANKADNKYCDRLQILIGSEKVALGISIKNVRRVHLVMPSWNLPSTDQAQARGFRVGGHEALPPEGRVIKIFRHIAVEKGSLDKGKGFPKSDGFSDKETTDVYIYRIAEKKNYRNAQIHRVLKEIAFDCSLFYGRNVLPEDINGSRDCDYQKCNYQCDNFEPTSNSSVVWSYDIPEDELDYSTYNLFYSSDKIKKVMNEIVNIFGKYFSLHIDRLMELLVLDVSEKNILLNAITTLIDTRVVIKDSYGFNRYLKEDKNIIFIDSSYTPSSYSEAIYAENPLVADYIDMDSVIEIIELDTDRAKIDAACRNKTSNFDELLKSLSYRTKIVLLESAFVLDKKEKIKRNKKLYDKILEDMGESIYKTKDGNMIHILYSEEFKGVSYDVAAKDIKAQGTMRVFDPDLHRWLYLDDLQKEEKYIAEIKTKRAEQKTIGFEDNPFGVYGWVSKKDESFRVVIKQDKAKKSGKGRERGQICVTMEIPDILDIFINRIDYLPETELYEEVVNREELLRLIRGKMDIAKRFEGKIAVYTLDDLKKFLALITMDRIRLCTALKAWFEDNSLLYFV